MYETRSPNYRHPSILSMPSMAWRVATGDARVRGLSFQSLGMRLSKPRRPCHKAIVTLPWVPLLYSSTKHWAGATILCCRGFPVVVGRRTSSVFEPTRVLSAMTSSDGATCLCNSGKTVTGLSLSWAIEVMYYCIDICFVVIPFAFKGIIHFRFTKKNHRFTYNLQG